MADFHKPIPTTYNGTTYRSRLEARWALFFDEIGFCYSYEPFTVENNGLSWTPDFEIMIGLETRGRRDPQDKVRLVEIKPTKPTKEYFEYLMKIRDVDRSDFLVFVGQPERLIVAYLISTGITGGMRGSFTKQSFVDTVAILQCPVCGLYYTEPYIEEYGGILETGPHCFLPKLASIEDVIERVKNYRFDLDNSQNQ